MSITEVTRREPPHLGGEREVLEGFLDWHRDTLLNKCAGLDDAQLKRRPCEPSTLSLLGLVRHLTDAESGWFSDFVGRYEPRYRDPGQRDAPFDDLDSAPVAEVFAAYRAECDRSRAAVAGIGLDESYTDERGRTFSLRWVYVHMIEEYARHNGHADLIRQRLDGATGE
jgi:uncharacterized damage-inducible protein DinB